VLHDIAKIVVVPGSLDAVAEALGLRLTKGRGGLGTKS
jgi:hypothetical protein